jgi:hypothetical protein
MPLYFLSYFFYFLKKEITNKEKIQNKQDSDFAGPQLLSFESLMDLNHLNNFQLFFPFILFAVTSL